MALRRFRVKSGKFSLRTEKGKTRHKPGEAFIAFDYQVPEAFRDIVEPLEEITDPGIRKEYEPKEEHDFQCGSNVYTQPGIRKEYEPKEEPINMPLYPKSGSRPARKKGRPKTAGKRGKPPKKDIDNKQENLRPVPLEDNKWDVVNVVTDKKVNDKPLTVEEVAKLIDGFTGD